MKIRNVILVLLIAYFTFGGTFTCTAHDGDSTVHVKNGGTNQDKSK